VTSLISWALGCVNVNIGAARCVLGSVVVLPMDLSPSLRRNSSDDVFRQKVNSAQITTADVSGLQQAVRINAYNAELGAYVSQPCIV